MQPDFNERMRSGLLEARGRLSRADAALAAEGKELLDGGDVDLVDHAQTATALDGVRQRDDTERAELSELDAALSRLALGTYGVCEECGEPVPRERLEVLPSARKCLECASARARQARG
jgi:RNA polymerase-binding transcription factor DksA